MITHFTSDPHYGHHNIIAYCNRPYANVQEMNADLIARYNSVVPKDGVCLWAGDSFFCEDWEAREIMRQLNGRKILVVGNHDRKPYRLASFGFELFTNQLVLRIRNRVVRVSHYPYTDTRFPHRCPKMQKDELLIHGHTHSTNVVQDNMIHVGVDAWDYKPATLAEIEQIVEAM